MFEDKYNLEKLVYSSDASTYVEARLSHGLTLGKMLAERDNFQSGSFISYTQKGLGVTLPLNLNTRLFMKSKPTEEHLAEIATYYLNQDTLHVVLSEEPYMDKSDISNDVDVNYLVYNNEIYYFANKVTSKDTLLYLIDVGRSYPGLIYFTKFSSKLGNLNQEIHLTDLTQLLDNIQLVIVDAFDGEGWLYWEQGTFLK